MFQTHQHLFYRGRFSSKWYPKQMRQVIATIFFGFNFFDGSQFLVTSLINKPFGTIETPVSYTVKNNSKQCERWWPYAMCWWWLINHKSKIFNCWLNPLGVLVVKLVWLNMRYYCNKRKLVSSPHSLFISCPSFWLAFTFYINPMKACNANMKLKSSLYKKLQPRRKSVVVYCF